MFLFELQWGVPVVLFLLPLVILPWISAKTEKTIVWSQFIPTDPVSEFIGMILKALASVVFFCLILSLAKPYYPEQIVQRLSSGAEIIILVDRSRSMDDPFTPANKAVAASRTVGMDNSKRQIANKHLLEFINKRPNDRFGFILFSNKALDLLPFTNNRDSVRAVIKASSLGKGLSETNIVQALIKAAEMYTEEDYHGSRAVLLLSDGGQVLSDEDKRLIRDLFQREKITLYWLYMGGINGLTSNKANSSLSTTPDKKWHEFFETLYTPYIGFEIESLNNFSDILDIIDKEQTETLIVNETIPREPMAEPFLLIAIVASFILLLSYIYTVWGVRSVNQ
jgi:mxaC protein